MQSVEIEYDRDSWRTPPAVFKMAQEIIGEDFTFDAACTLKNSLCPDGAFFDLGENGLDVPWGAVTWCNPPYSDIQPWIEKAAFERDKNCRKSCLLIPCDPSTKMFRQCVDLLAKIYMISGRLAFLHPVTGEPISGNRHGSMLVFFEKFSVGKICVIDRP